MKMKWAMLTLAMMMAVILRLANQQVSLAQREDAPRAPNAGSSFYLPLVSYQPAPVNTFADQVIALVNQERANAGCPALTPDATLMNVALAHSTDMALHDFFNHTGSDGSAPDQRMTRAGYIWSRMAENIAAGYATPQSVVTAWMNSTQGHRENILNCSLRDTGVGYYYLANDTGAVNYHHYWTQDFGTR